MSDGRDQFTDCFDCTDSTYNQEVCRYATQRVMDEMFTTLQITPYLLADYEQFNATQQIHFQDVWTHCFPRGEAPADPFLPTFPHHNPLETRVREPTTNRNRCAAAALSGFRCSHHILYPLTVCAVHAQYYTTHLRLPPGGTTTPQLPHKTDIDPNAILDFPTPEMRRIPTTQSLQLIQRVNNPPPAPKPNATPQTHSSITLKQ